MHAPRIAARACLTGSFYCAPVPFAERTLGGCAESSAAALAFIPTLGWIALPIAGGIARRLMG